MIRVGVIGYGYWGPGIVRNFHGVEGCEVAMVCDKSTSALKRAKQAYPGIEVTSDPCDILGANDIDAVAVITPVWTHFELAKGALENGKHVFVEKPFTSTADQAEQLIDLADQQEPADHGRSHVPVHRRGEEDPPADRRRRARQAVLLRLHPREPWACSSTTATSFGILAPHDLSIVDYLIKDKPN